MTDDGFIQILPNDLVDSTVAAQYGLTITQVPGPTNLIEVRGAVDDLVRFVVDFNLEVVYPIQE